jgi:hypothetical protein
MIYYLYIHSYMFRSYDHHQAEKYIATLGLLNWQRIRIYHHTTLTLRRRIKTHIIRYHTHNMMQTPQIKLTQLYFNSCLLFYSNYPLRVSTVRPSSSGDTYIWCIYFRLKIVVRPKYIANNLNKIVNNCWNRVALEGNAWAWSNTSNST